MTIKSNMIEKHKSLIIAIIIVLFLFVAESIGSFIESKEALAHVMFDIANNIRLMLIK